MTLVGELRAQLDFLREENRRLRVELNEREADYRRMENAWLVAGIERDHYFSRIYGHNHHPAHIDHMREACKVCPYRD